jgi:plasmid maintenance system antidote protein VapI
MLKQKVQQFMETGISLKSISSLAGVHYTTLSKWINNERELNNSNKIKVEKALKEMVEKLLYIFNS